MSIKTLIAAAACAMAITSPAMADPVIVFPAPTLLTASEVFSIRDSSGGQAVTDDIRRKRDEFLGLLADGHRTENFDTTPLNSTVPMNVTFSSGVLAGPITATITGTVAVKTGVDSGRFDTTNGALSEGRYLLATAGGTGGFTINFDRAVSAFGFTGTDVGDFLGGVSIILSPSTGGPDEEAVIHAPGNAAINSDVLFWGFASRTRSYNKITFVTTGNSADPDGFGFDDFIVADLAPLAAPGAAPEPGSLALAGLALLGLGAARRRSRG